MTGTATSGRIAEDVQVIKTKRNYRFTHTCIRATITEGFRVILAIVYKELLTTTLKVMRVTSH